MSSSTDSEKNFTSALILALSTLNYTPTREDVEQKARQLSQIFGYKGTLEPIIEEALIAIDTRMGCRHLSDRC